MAGNLPSRNKATINLDKILDIKQAIEISGKIRRGGKLIVLAGGCFDILHKGHLLFLRNARDQGDVLFLFLESDENVKRLKGDDRPINSQEVRAKALSNLPFVDYVIKLSKLPTDKYYDRLIAQIKPDVIAVTEEDPNLAKREDQASRVGGKVKSVTRRTKYSTTDKIAQLK